MSLRPHIHEILPFEAGPLKVTGECESSYHGFPVNLDRAISGESIKAKITHRKRRGYFATTVEVLQPSKDRVDPLCPVFDQCGGCQWQHVDIKAQENAKSRLLNQCLAPAGLDKYLDKIIQVSPPFEYRTRAEPELTVQGGKVVWGIHALRSHGLVPNSECKIYRPALHKVVNIVGHMLEQPEVIPLIALFANRGGLIRAFHVRIGANTDDVLVGFFTGPGDLPIMDQWVEELKQQVPGLVGIVRNIGELDRGTLLGPETQVIWGKPEIRENIGGVDYYLGIEDFFQGSPEAAACLQKEVLDAVFVDSPGRPVAKSPLRILDLYSGVGFFGLALAKKGASVLCIEENARSLTRGQRAAKDQGIKNINFVAAKAEKLLRGMAERKAHFDCLVVDPPRPGIHPRALRAILELMPRKIVYVSCNPVTLGSDLVRLEQGGYNVTKIRGFDLFPQTRHLEAVAILNRQE